MQPEEGSRTRSAASTYDPIVGRALGDFVVRDRIGEGGFGAVYRAEQPALEREAVIKVLHARHHANQEVIKRFMREARLASRLEHPYAAHVYAFGAERDGLLWIAMELVRGTPLDKWLRLRGPMPLEQLVPLLGQICEVVHTAHEQGIVHRDLKPGNVLVISRAGRLMPKLLDFGIAKLVQEAPDDGEQPAEEPAARGKAALHPPHADDEAACAPTEDTVSGEQDTQLLDSTGAAPAADRDSQAASPSRKPAVSVPAHGSTVLTEQGQGFGSPPYMAPEQWVNAPSVGPRTDIYALGVLCFELLCGKPPFIGTTAQDIAIQHAAAPVPLLGEGFPHALDEVLARAMAKGVEERYATALELAEAVRQASGLEVETVPLPRLAESVREAVVADAPQPLAETVAALDAARHAHHAREAMSAVAGTAARLVGVLALACRTRVGPGETADSTIVIDKLRALRRRDLDDREWVALATELCRPFAKQRDAYPVPEIVDLLLGPDGGADNPDESFAAQLATVLSFDSTASTEEQVYDELERKLPTLASLLRSLEFLSEYRLVVARGSHAESWMGVRRPQRAAISTRGPAFEPGRLALLDTRGRPVLALWPLAQVARPAPGADEEIFLLAGSGRHGARLIARPAGFERQDDAFWKWFGANLLGADEGGAAAVEAARAPYPGLSAFTPDDAAVFFGRERETQTVVNRLRMLPILTVAGPSGTGKSSFVQAGVSPELPTHWRAITMRPGSAPLAALASRLRSAGIGELEWDKRPDSLGRLLRDAIPTHETLVVIVDQLEELFTLCLDEGERERFAAALADAARASDGRARVVLTLRDDFLVRAEELTAFRERLAPGLQLMTTPGRSDLLRILTEPAKRAGYDFEDADLAEEIVDEVAGQPGALALLAFTAAKLWQLRDRQFHQLTRKAYQALGGVGGALAKHAESMLDDMSPEDRRLVREAFRHLVTAEGTRAVLDRSEIEQVLGSGKRAEAVVERLIGARLLVASEGEGGQERVEVVHEALLSAWPRLVRWRREDAEGARLRDQLRAAARQWDERGRERGLLWRDDALAEYKLWRERFPGAVTEVESAFGEASLADEARGRRLRRLAFGAAFAGLSIALVVVLFFARRAEDQRQVAEQQRQVADSERSRAEESAAEARDTVTGLYEERGREAFLAGNAAEALVYLGEAYQRGADSPAIHLLLAMATKPFEAELVRFEGHTDRVRSAEYSPDGTRVLTASSDRTARIWDAQSGRLLVTLSGHDDDVYSARFSPDGKRVATASWDRTAKIWDAGSGALVATLSGHKKWVFSAEFSPDGARVVTASEDGTAKIWDVAQGTLLASLDGHKNKVNYAVFSPDGAFVATASSDGTAKLWNAANGRPICTFAGHRGGVVFLAFDPAGAQLATASRDASARTWQVAQCEPLASLKGHRDAVVYVSFSGDGTRVVTASQDKTAKVWSASTGDLLANMVGHSRGVECAELGPQGKRVVTGSFDQSARLWDAASGVQLVALHGHGGTVHNAHFDRSGDRILTGSWDGTARIWKTEQPLLRVELAGHRAPIWDASFSPDGARIATASADHTARIWDASTGRLMLALEGHAGVVRRARFGPDSARLITASDDRTAKVWDVASGRELATLDSHEGAVQAAEISPDGTRIATTGEDGMLKLWDGHTYELLASRRAHDGPAFASVVWTQLFIAGGARLVTVGDDKSAKIWDARTLELVATLSGHEAAVTDAVESPDHRLLVTTSNDKTARVWDAESGALRFVLKGHRGIVFTARFSPDGARLVTASEDGSPRVWDARTGELIGSLAHGGTVPFAMYAPDGAFLATAGADQAVKLWDARSLAPLAKLEGHTSFVLKAGFGADSSQLLTAGFDGTARLWDLSRERRSPGEISALIRCRVPFTLTDGRVVPGKVAPFDCLAH